MKSKKKKIDTYKAVYIYLVALRIILTISPQIGYIHPDEYFQSVEVLAGKFLDVESSPPWEFKTSTPIRSMTIPYFTIGMSIKFLKDLNYLCKEYLSFPILSSYSLLITPRFLICLCSFLVDYCLFKICSNNNEKYKSRLIILASSYVLIIYGTRTFSNTIELILFAVLLYFVSESMIFSNIISRNREYVNYRYEQSKNTVERAKFHKLRLYFISDSYRSCWIISTITVMGFFNRPTFLAFAVIPIFFWLYRGIGTKTVTVVQFHTRILVLGVCAIPMILTIVLIDSFFYGFLTWGEVGVLEISINNFVFTPLNFLKYNMNPENLALHGLHPRYLHALVNIPLLFNVLGIIAAYTILKYVYWCCQNKINLLPSIRTIKCLMTLSVIVPVALLSLFPHQEPRFLIPILLPLVYLHGMTVLPEADHTLVEAPKNQTYGERVSKHQSYTLLKFWLFINTLLLIFYGFLHQGGVFQATYHLQKELETTPQNIKYHIVTTYMYSLPESFLLQLPSDKTLKRGNKQFKVDRRVYLYEEGSKDIKFIVYKLSDILKHTLSQSKKAKVFLLIAGSRIEELEYFAKKRHLKLELQHTFSPHFATEAFPNLSKYCIEPLNTFYNANCHVIPLGKYFWYLLNVFKLNLFKITEREVNKIRNVANQNEFT